MIRRAWHGRDRRLAFGLAGVAVLFAVLGGGLLYGLRQDPPHLIGTNLGRHDLAPAFTLHDASGQSLALDTLRGKVVVLTFLYTHCPDVCPLTADLLRRADELAGHPREVVYVAVSVDPSGDTPESIAAFEAEHRLSELGDRWHYLVGTPDELGPVWSGYYVRQYEPAPAGTQPDHVSAIYLIDRRGNRRVLVHVDTPAEVIAHDEQALRKE